MPFKYQIFYACYVFDKTFIKKKKKCFKLLSYFLNEALPSILQLHCLIVIKVNVAMIFHIFKILFLIQKHFVRIYIYNAVEPL